MAGADRGGILVQGDIAHMMDGFDAPVVAAKGLELRRIHFVMGAAAEHDFGLLSDVNRFEVMGGAQNDGSLCRVREAR